MLFKSTQAARAGIEWTVRFDAAQAIESYLAAYVHVLQSQVEQTLKP